MYRRLWVRLALALVSLGAGSVIIFAILVNTFLGNQFRGYVRENLEHRASQLAAAMVIDYQREGAWNRRTTMQMAHLAMMEGLVLTLEGADGKVVFSTDPSGWASTMGGMHVPEGFQNHADITHTVAVPLVSEGKEVGTLIVGSPKGVGSLSEHDLQFVEGTNRLVAAAAAGAVLLAVLLSLLLARNLTAPLAFMTDVAQQMRRGNLSPRVPPGGLEELDQLGRALNHLAESLTHQEGNRESVDIGKEAPFGPLPGFLAGLGAPTPGALGGLR